MSRRKRREIREETKEKAQRIHTRLSLLLWRKQMEQMWKRLSEIQTRRSERRKKYVERNAEYMK